MSLAQEVQSMVVKRRSAYIFVFCPQPKRVVQVLGRPPGVREIALGMAAR